MINIRETRPVSKRNDHYYQIVIITWSQVIVNRLLVLDKNTWNHIIVGYLFTCGLVELKSWALEPQKPTLQYINKCKTMILWRKKNKILLKKNVLWCLQNEEDSVLFCLNIRERKFFGEMWR